ncbi:MAG: hypothetical protein Q7R47_01065 [Candidatus Diapherotrites archaeon]|nr:hypothetical protein [Candidatus Diapherotrites archaeon]
MAQARVKGYVVGSDELPYGTVWKVRISDVDGGPHLMNGKKLAVASVGEGITLAPGLNVDFIVGTQQHNGKPVPAAVDVRITAPAGDPPQVVPKVSAKEQADVFTVFVAVSEERHSLVVHPYWTVDKVIEDLRRASDDSEQVVAARSFTEDECGSVFHIMRGLASCDEVAQLETFLQHIFDLGVDYQKKKGN